MGATLKGRTILPGNVSGIAVVSKVGFNTYASFFDSIHTPSPKAVCADSGNMDLYGTDLAGKIICLPHTTGSTSSGAVWQRLVKMGNAPLAMLFSKPIDSLAAGGLIVADIWAGKRIVVVDSLGDALLEMVNHGDVVDIREDGVVELCRTR
jgi:predicted aconitase with swiveling domain